MTREVQGIPPAPRRVRWRAVLWYGWPLCLRALLLTVYGGVFNWMLLLAYSGKAGDNARLDQEPTVRAEGIVTLVEPGKGHHDGKLADLLEFKFTYAGQSLTNQCFGPSGLFVLGEKVEVELLPDELHMSRITGTWLDLLPVWLSPWTVFRCLVLPGFALLLLWLGLVLRLRRTMSIGDVAVAELDSVRRLRRDGPAM
jgi:hypothetical protein